MFTSNKKELSELIGIIIGDGNIYYNKNFRKYYFEITGHPKLDLKYFNYISNLVYKILKKRPSIRIGGRGLRLRLYSKQFIEFLIYEIRLPYGNIKCGSIKIPKYVLSSGWNIIKLCIKGITDTDGSFFLANKGYRKNYPCIEIRTTSKSLAFQLKSILSKRYRIGFRKFSRGNLRDVYTISLNGDIVVNKWVKEIGFSNLRKLKK